MDDTAENYDAQATIADNSSCTYGEEGQIYGCTDQNAENYNPDATDLNGSCTYILGCTDPDAENYNSNATQSNNSCTYEEDEEDDEDEILGCTNPNAPNYDSQATQDNGSCQ
jgi:hypothetical protein